MVHIYEWGALTARESQQGEEGSRAKTTSREQRKRLEKRKELRRLTDWRTFHLEDHLSSIYHDSVSVSLSPSLSPSKVWGRSWFIFYFYVQGMNLFKWSISQKGSRLSEHWSKFKFISQLSLLTNIMYFKVLKWNAIRQDPSLQLSVKHVSFIKTLSSTIF